MKILGEKVIQDNRCLVFSMGKTVWKVPLTPSTWKEADLEKKMIMAARRDPHFGRYLPSYRFVSHISKTPYMTSMISHPQRELFMKEYFVKAFARSPEWPLVSLRTLADLGSFSSFLRVHTQENLVFWDGVLGSLEVSQSSSHGDFHIDHVFLDGEKLYFIDWTLYSSNSSRYFDLINFWIFSQKAGKESWMEIWKKNSAKPPKEIFGVSVSQSEYRGYAILKVATEVKLLNLRNRLDARKQKKYRNFISHLGRVFKTLNYE